MSHPDNHNKHAHDAAFTEKLRRAQADFERQAHSVVRAAQTVIEEIDTNGTLSLEICNHGKAQIFKAHLYLDDLEKALDAMP